MIYGSTNEMPSSHSFRALHYRTFPESEDPTYKLHAMMQSYFDVESFGIKADAKKLIPKADERALSILEAKTKRVGGRYETGLLWREDVPPFPNSYHMALNRLKNVERKMSKDEVFATEYRAKISDYLKKGYPRKLSSAEASQVTNKTFYLPHFGVRNPNKKGIRLVFDAAAEVQNMSLNKALLSGPDINNSLISILLKFRQAPIAVCGDIKEMFHQIIITAEDRDSQRFLWRDGDPSKQVETFRMERMIFGSICSPTIRQKCQREELCYRMSSRRARHYRKTLRG
ncbi:PREDICTED: uncharacterized protein LOC108376960 [Rhagoletis zephyria]|uniref:uncharacterized protein LOC108376960 n=1 Tax=Rhagoletis zephyria TaxID=28612 RepID=UPI0008112A59|nr:PREDICTED: uncharacterized protein LOC108376960 [Rhagoletis zephyria]